MSDFVFDVINSLPQEAIDRLESWKTNVAILSFVVFFLYFVFPTSFLIEKYVLYPMMARFFKGVWTKNPAFWAHSRMMEDRERKRKMKEEKSDGEIDDEDDDEPCPELIPADEHEHVEKMRRWRINTRVHKKVEDEKPKKCVDGDHKGKRESRWGICFLKL